VLLVYLVLNMKLAAVYSSWQEVSTQGMSLNTYANSLKEHPILKRKSTSENRAFSRFKLF